MSTWTKPRLTCLSNDEVVTARCDCPREDYRHAAAFRAELINADSGEVHRAMLCFERGRLFAENHQLEFPPWRDQGGT